MDAGVGSMAKARSVFSNQLHLNYVEDISQIFNTDFTPFKVAEVNCVGNLKQNPHVTHEDFAADSPGMFKEFLWCKYLA